MKRDPTPVSPWASKLVNPPLTWLKEGQYCGGSIKTRWSSRSPVTCNQRSVLLAAESLLLSLRGEKAGVTTHLESWFKNSSAKLWSCSVSSSIRGGLQWIHSAAVKICSTTAYWNKCFHDYWHLCQTDLYAEHLSQLHGVPSAKLTWNVLNRLL